MICAAQGVQGVNGEAGSSHKLWQVIWQIWQISNSNSLWAMVAVLFLDKPRCGKLDRSDGLRRPGSRDSVGLGWRPKVFERGKQHNQMRRRWQQKAPP